MTRCGSFGGDGVSRVMASWVRALEAHGVDVTVFHGVAPVGASARCPAACTVTYSQSGLPLIRPALWTSRLSSAVKAEHARKPFDALLSHDTVSVRSLAAAVPGVPIHTTVHSPIVEENRLNNWNYAGRARRLFYPLTRAMAVSAEAAALRHSAAVHTLSEYTWRLLQGRYPDETRSLKWRCVPGAIDAGLASRLDRHDARARLGLSGSTPVLLSARRMVPRNGVHRILKAARACKLAGIEARFILVGQGQDLPSLKRMSVREGLSSVSFEGFISDERLADLYCAADAFLMPTRALECFGLPVVEAMAFGCMPLVMPDGGPAEICAPWPVCIAEGLGDTDFVDLVMRFLSTPTQSPQPAVFAEAARGYWEESLAPRMFDSVLKCVQDFRGDA